MKSADIRSSFIEYFSKKGHAVVPSSSLLPEKDPTLLFTNAGMVQFKTLFLDEEKRDYTRAVSCQKCMRAGGKHNDLENVGRTERHHTFFEMLGNFSFGDYFKEDAIKYAWEFLTVEMGLPADRLWVTVYEDDDEAAEIWTGTVKVPAGRVVRMGEKDNFWSMGDRGPCGPCSEILIDQGPEMSCGLPTCAPGCDCDRYLEIWNLVFMQYDRDSEGALTALPRPCIDTGMGLERLTAVKQGVRSNYDTDLFRPIIERIERLSGAKYGKTPESDVSIKAVADHARAVSFLIADGIMPGNEGRGYVLRRIIRRAARHGRFLGLAEPFLHKVCVSVTKLLGGVYPELDSASELITRATRGEEERFFETLERGLQLLEAEVARLRGAGETVVPGKVAFRLYDTYGFPVDLTADIIRKDGLTVDDAGFDEAMAAQKEMARRAGIGVEGAEASLELYRRISSGGVKTEFTGYRRDTDTSRVARIIRDGAEVESASAGETVQVITEKTPFYGESGGQIGDTGAMTAPGVKVRVTDAKRALPDLIVHHCRVEEGTLRTGDTALLAIDAERRSAIRRNHTATHLLHAAMRNILGEHVRQAGSLVTADGLRFDFSHFEALTDREIREIEEQACRAVMENREVATDVLPYREAVERGALAFFGEKYADVVRLVSVEGVSKELCGGTHVARTGDIGLIKITGESSVAAGVRRIEALTGEAALARILDTEKTVREVSRALKVPRGEITGKVTRLLDSVRELEKEVERLKGSRKADSAAGLAGDARVVKGVKVLAALVEVESGRELRAMADTLRGKLGSGVVVLGGPSDGKALVLAAVTRDLAGRISAGDLIKKLAPIVGGRGGGKAELAQAGGTEPERLGELIEAAYRTVEESL